MIRVMQETDIPQLAQLFLKGRRQTFHWVDPAHFRLEDFDEQTRGEQIWIAEQGERLAGLSPSGEMKASFTTCMSRPTGMGRGWGGPC